jgi:hypothetical protein
MKSYSKIISLVVIVSIILSAFSGTSSAATSKNVSIHNINVLLKVLPFPEEVSRGVSYGFVPKEIQRDLGTAITFSQYCSMLSKMIALYDKSFVPDFNKYAKLALTSKKTMKREDGMLVAYYAALSMKMGNSEENFSNGNWQKIHELCGERAWDDFSWNYPLFPNWNKQTNIFNGNYMTNAYFFAMAQYSCLNGKQLFDFDDKNHTMHVNQPLTREAAIASVVRLYESVKGFEPVERVQTKWDKEFFKSYSKRLNEIINSETTIKKSTNFIPGKTYTGTAYYISPSGDNDNDGLSPEQPWASVERTYGQLQIGDAVFFERGGIWREELQCADGVTYSAYGSGDKPCFYGSQENGTGADKWSLWQESKSGEKIWKFYKDVSDCGGIVFNDGKSHANRVFSYWDGSRYVFMKNQKRPFDIAKGLEYDLQFYSTFNPSKIKMPIYVYNEDSRGPLYLRCDAGNPGTIYTSIEFQTAPKPEAGYCGIIKAAQGCVIDNLCVKYGISRGIAAHQNSNVIIQNCEVGWIGGGTHEINGSGYIPVSGEGIGIEGSNNVAVGCYVHDCFDGGIISELDADFPFFVENQTIKGNIIERCISGILIASHRENDLVNPTFGNCIISDNYILYSGYGWSCDPHYDFTWGDKIYNGNAITFWDNPNINKGISVKNNTLYLAKSGLIHLGMDKKYWPDFEGNTYVQNLYGTVGFLDTKFGVCFKGSELTKFIKEVMGDKSANVIDPN